MLALALASTAAVSFNLLRSYLLDRLDAQLNNAADSVAPGLVTGLSPVPPGTQPDAGQLPSDYVLQLTFTNGPSLVWRNPMVTELPALPRLSPAEASGRGRAAFTVSAVRGDDQWRAVARPLPQDAGSIVVALPLRNIEQTVDRLAAIELIVCLSALVVAMVLGVFVVRRALRPLTEIEQVAADIAGGDLSRRVPERPEGTEIGSLSRSLNAMLGWIEQAFDARAASDERMRRFVSDASHELRTPLATVRGYAELYRQGAVQSSQQISSVMARIEDEAIRMSALVEDLLLLARLDERRPATYETVDLTVLAGDAVADARARSPEREISLTGLDDGLGPVEVAGDEHQLRQVIANLVSNALRHTPEGTPVEVAVGVISESGDSAAAGPSGPGVSASGRTDSPGRGVPGRAGPGPSGRGNGPVLAISAVVEVRDHGPGIPPELAGRVFERFFRADPARGRGANAGTGLGLSIVAAIAAEHGGTVAVRETPGGGATFALRLPALHPGEGTPEPEYDPDSTDPATRPDVVSDTGPMATVDVESAETGPTQAGPTGTGPTETGPAETGSTETASAEDRSAAQESAEDGSAGQVSAGQESAAPNSTEPTSAAQGTAYDADSGNPSGQTSQSGDVQQTPSSG